MASKPIKNWGDVEKEESQRDLLQNQERMEIKIMQEAIQTHEAEILGITTGQKSSGNLAKQDDGPNLRVNRQNKEAKGVEPR